MTDKLYIGNLPYSATEQQVEDLFTSVGLVKSVRLIQDRETGRPKGFGFVTMDSSKLAQEAIEKLHDQDFNGRKMKVTFAVEKTRIWPKP